MSIASRNVEGQSRSLGGTEQNWCKAVANGTGITALALLISKDPNTSQFKKALQKLQNNHPNLNYTLQKNSSTGSASFTINPPIVPDDVRLNIMSLSKTSELLQTLMSHGSNSSLSPLHVILEHELNINEWSDNSSRLANELHLWFANVYTLADNKRVLVFRFHAGICDRTTAVSFLKELKEAMGEKEGGGYKDEGNMGIEELIPVGKTKKTLWAHGKDMVTYSVNSLRLTNLKFKEVKSPRRSEVVRLKMNKHETHMLLAGCKLRGLKLCGPLAAASLLASYSSKRQLTSSYQRKKYGVIFLNDCRSYLQPSLSIHEFGFYHSAISTSHEVKGEETLWDLATKIYKAFENSKNNNKHFSDMTDLNFLMSKAIDNPSLTPSSSMRTSLVTVFEDPVIEITTDAEQELGLDDYIGCASAHGVGPSIAIFDTVRDGELDCACVYPAPLHSREQMLELLANMKIRLLEGFKNGEKIET